MSAGVSTRRRWKGALTALIAAALMFTGVGAAAAAPTPGTGSVSGTVTRAADGLPAAGVEIHVVLQDFSGGESATTAPDGTFSVDGLVPGTYLVSFAQSSDDYVMQWWRGAANPISATPITVEADQTVTGIDTALAAAGSISGTVTRAADGMPAVGIQVRATNWGGGQYLATTDGTGAYRLTGVAPGAYQVSFTDPAGALLPQFRQAAAEAGVASTGVDAALPTGATITGHVRAASDGRPVGGSVSASGPAGWFTAPIASDGSYVLRVAEGTYTVRFQSYDSTLLSEYWRDALELANATPVTVAAGHDATDVDAELSQALFLRGTVSIDGTPGLGSGRALSITVTAFAGGKQAGMGYVHQDGTYSIQVPAGTYTLVAQGAEMQMNAFAPQYYAHASSEAEATPVVLGTSDVTGLDFDLSWTPADVSSSASSAHAGDTIAVSGSGFVPGEPVSIELHSTPVVLASVKADESGAVAATVTLPADTALGAHEIVLTGSYSGTTGATALTVVAPGGGPVTEPGGATGGAASPSGAGASSAAQLAATGSDLPSGEMGLAALLLLAGAVLVRIRRRQQA
ncbi:MSCRAMM family protein [Microbacterium azadirachtae]|uniref:MSCRAMM family protein n=1 Tax=Microbacterium azadirachtae TaxID=582680 RepID=UPI00088C4CD2|nr:carboxypeptidase-like regulatory domain-containing protein [Microbacterium azadirachtae]SDL76776.1 Carboxypeptidase regulatory-like domain-containing protein [Microbacterium azadirachtae]SEG05986.1 Carboxypeptidase regulatory-like domain-containing protein [Microbacterium azadirachtae]SEG08515.1 Carboxypeptidase regulatory-like domain-containing protein [Microbacterium azadirachtae]